MNAPNPTAAAFRAHGAFNGLSPLDESVAAHRETQRTLASVERDRERLERTVDFLSTQNGRFADRLRVSEHKLKAKDARIAELIESLAASEAANDELRTMLAERKEVTA